MLIAIRPSDGDDKPGGPLGAFRDEQAMSRHRVSPSPILSSHTPQHNYIILHKQLHVQLPELQLPTVHYTDTRPTSNVVCRSGARFKSRPYSTPSIRPARNPKRVIMQWVGIGTHIQRVYVTIPTLRSIFVGYRRYVGQVAQAARRLATGWTARVRSRVSEGWRFFFTPSCPDWPWGPLNLL